MAGLATATSPIPDTYLGTRIMIVHAVLMAASCWSSRKIYVSSFAQG